MLSSSTDLILRAVRSTVSRRMIQKAAPPVPSGPSFETRLWRSSGRGVGSYG
jgi:hypothetical protein